MQAVQWVSSFMQSTSERFRTCFSNNFATTPHIFTEDDLSEYIALTHLTKEQILRAYNNFCSMQPEGVNVEKNPILSKDQVINMPEFQVNPFKDRLFKVFSTYEDHFTFEDYLDMMSVLSKAAPVNLKAEYAFQMYDFDEDDMLSSEDLINLIKILKTDVEMEEKDMRDVAVKVLIDGDVDEDGCLAFTEFLHLVVRLKDFESSFNIRL